METYGTREVDLVQLTNTPSAPVPQSQLTLALGKELLALERHQLSQICITSDSWRSGLAYFTAGSLPNVGSKKTSATRDVSSTKRKKSPLTICTF